VAVCTTDVSKENSSNSFCSDPTQFLGQMFLHLYPRLSLKDNTTSAPAVSTDTTYPPPTTDQLFTTFVHSPTSFVPFLSIVFVYSLSSMSDLTFSRIDRTSFYPWLRSLFPCLNPHLLCSSLSLLHITWFPLDLLRVPNSFYFTVLVAPLTLFFPCFNFSVSHLPSLFHFPHSWLYLLHSWPQSLRSSY